MDLLGASTIIELTENSKEARICNRRYETVREEVIRSNTWKCANVRGELGEESSEPCYGFAHEYNLTVER